MLRFPPPTFRSTAALLLTGLLVLGAGAAWAQIGGGGIRLTADATDVTIVPGASGTITLRVNNTALTPTTVTLTTSASNASVSGSVSPSSFTVTPGAREDATLTISVASSASEGAVLYLTVSADASPAESRDNVMIRVTVGRRPVPSLSLTLTPPSLAMRAGSVANVTGRVDNTGETPLDLAMSALDLPPGWSVAFSPATLHAARGESKTFTARVSVPGDATPGETHPFSVRAHDAARDVANAAILHVEVQAAPPPAPAPDPEPEPAPGSGTPPPQEKQDNTQPANDPDPSASPPADGSDPEIDPSPHSQDPGPRVIASDTGDDAASPDGGPQSGTPDGAGEPGAPAAQDAPTTATPLRAERAPIARPDGESGEGAFRSAGEDAQGWLDLAVTLLVPTLAAAAAVVAGDTARAAAFLRRLRASAGVLAGVLLYTRLSPSQVLEHPVRARLMGLVTERPGIHFSEAQRALGLRTGAVVFHLRVLERAGLIVSRKEGNRRLLFPRARAAEPQDPAAVPAQASLRARVRAALAQDPAASAAALAREWSTSRQAVSYHVRQLRAQTQAPAIAKEPAQFTLVQRVRQAPQRGAGASGSAVTDTSSDSS